MDKDLNRLQVNWAPLLVKSVWDSIATKMHLCGLHGEQLLSKPGHLAETSPERQVARVGWVPVRLERFSGILLSMFCRGEMSFAHACLTNTRPENTVMSRIQGEFRPTMGRMELVENMVVEGGRDDLV